jgi:hypothetical protein
MTTLRSLPILFCRISDALEKLATPQEVLKALKGNIKCEKHEKESPSKGIYQLWRATFNLHIGTQLDDIKFYKGNP